MRKVTIVVAVFTDELPGVGVMEVGAGESPEENDKDGGGEGHLGADEERGASCEGVKAAAILL